MFFLFLYRQRRIFLGNRESKNLLKFENMYLPVPPKAEQIKIAKFIESKYGNIEKSIELKKQQLEKLEEYKKSLIFEYVTGKKEV
ncbi:MAG: restriction endonuclease subunit S [Spirochaetales bacterium]|nr:restriction endonuclease subunit S [Spirochaetales bacterium]